MRGAQVAAILLLVVSSCRSIASSSGPGDRRLLPRSGGPGSRSPSPKKGATGLLGDIVAQGTKKHGQSSQTTHAHQGQALSSQATQARPAHLSHPTHSAGPTHTTFSAHAVQAAHTAHPTHMARPALGHQGAAAHPGNAAHPVGPAQVGKPAKAAQRKDGGRGRAKPSAMYVEWSNSLTGHLAKLQPGRGGGRYQPLGGVQSAKRPEKGGHTEGKWWKTPGGQPRSSPGTSSRFDRNKRYREKKKLKKLAESLGVEYPGHEEHPRKGGGKGGGGPGSPGAGSQAVSK